MLNYLFFIIKNAFYDLLRNKLRTLLTTLGVVIGVASVIILVSFGLGLKKYIADQLETFGTNLIMIFPGRSFEGGFPPAGGFLGGTKFDLNDVRRLKKLDSLSVVVPGYEKIAPLEAEGNSKMYEIIGSTEEIFEILKFEIGKGEFFNRAHVRRKSKVIVLGAGPAEKLFGGAEDALGKRVKIENQSFEVIGITKSEGGVGFGPTVDDHALIPYTAVLSSNPGKKFIALYALAKSNDQVEEAKEEAEEALLERYGEDDFSVIDQKEMLDVISSIFDVVNKVVISIAAISLVVGGVGIMNIMYVSVSEKTNEIGIRRAFGATKRDVLLQFLTESVVLAALGGVVGIGISFLVVQFVQNLFPAYINLTSVLLAVGVSSAIGLLFGILPAKRASEMSPIEAIRYE